MRKPVIAIATGSHYHSLALKADGSIVAWGLNDYGQLDIPVSNNYIGVSAGSGHSVALIPEPTTLGLLLLGGFSESEKVSRKPLILSVYGRLCQRCCVITFSWEQVIQNLTGLGFVSIAAIENKFFKIIAEMVAERLLVSRFRRKIRL